MGIWRLSLINSFGRHSAKPWQSTVQRLALLVSLALLAGDLLSRAILKLTLATGLPSIWLCAFVAITSFTVNGLILLAIGVNPYQQQDRAGLYNQSLIWPLNRSSTWVIRVLPLLIIWTILMIASIWVGWTLAKASNQHAYFILPAILLGSLAGAVTNLRSGYRTPPLIFVTISAVGFLALEQGLRHNNGLYLIGVFVPLSCMIISYLLSFVYRPPLRESHRLKNSLVLPDWLVRRNWFSLKIIRNKRTLASALFCLVITTSLAIIAIWRKLSTDSSWLMFGSLISLAFASDARGLSRRNRSIEVQGLNTTSYFIDRQFMNTFLTATLITLPLLFISLTAGSSAVLVTLEFLVCQLAGVSCGLLAGSWFVPTGGEVGVQFMAAIMGSGVFFGFSKLLGLSAASGLTQLAGWATLTASCLMAAYCIEHFRLRRYGHL